ncbi:FAD-dependent oxidoreductase [Pseudomonas fragi]|uniref:FAD-dependent oxidoreductase n=1 Tax=Pseudomonas fragi TaxID=296 RepID=A0A266LQT1_PSEFR|nr:NAD(P)/FAD-dependent oxidoreductase [Pseudomonas fragi]OZY39757.1 FAD-dependent oxidoreductase [Pseudomonas fragi]
MKKSILIIGAGFGGFWSALSAMRLLDKHGREDITVQVLAPVAELRVRPRFYEPQVHTMRTSLTRLFEATGVQFIPGVARQIDVEQQTVSYQDPTGVSATLDYSALVLAAGSQLNLPDIQGLQAHAFNVDSIEQAERLETHMHRLAALPDTPARSTVVVAGGGFTGIETACEMPERLREILGTDCQPRVIIIDRGQAVGAAMGTAIAPVIAEATAELGVEWCLASSVVAVDEHGVTLADGQRIDAATVVWTAGVRASELTAQVPAERDPLGRLHVDANLRVIGSPNVFATGDSAFAACDELGNHALMTCQHAIALGRSAGNNAAAQLLGVAPVPYSQSKYVTCLDLGAWGAVFTEGWDRQVKLVRQEGKALKTQINTQWIYPPIADRDVALAAADPLIPVVA